MQRSMWGRERWAMRSENKQDFKTGLRWLSSEGFKKMNQIQITFPYNPFAVELSLRDGRFGVDGGEGWEDLQLRCCYNNSVK